MSDQTAKLPTERRTPKSYAYSKRQRLLRELVRVGQARAAKHRQTAKLPTAKNT